MQHCPKQRLFPQCLKIKFTEILQNIKISIETVQTGQNNTVEMNVFISVITLGIAQTNNLRYSNEY